mmetsp:Transcript_56800/g.149624  ORF Transcript_56800/g.149624 Transcript_56800/m.149624 type:complete len:512 (+) Transcript_56800:17-1552(+)
MAPATLDTSCNLPPGIDYTLSACKGKWAYMNDEGGSYIFKGYRIGLNFRQCLVSMFQIHNETINVWSHLIGSILFISLCVYVLSSSSFDMMRSSNEDETFLAVGWNDGRQCFVNASFNLRKSPDLFELSASNDRLSVFKENTKFIPIEPSNWKKWQAKLTFKANSMRESMEHEASSLRLSVAEAISKVDRSLENVRHEIAVLGSASVEGCYSCLGELVQKLSQSRQRVLMQVDSLFHMVNSSHHEVRNQTGLGKRNSTMTSSINSGLFAAKQALLHASQNLRHELNTEIIALEEFRRELFAKKSQIVLARWPIIVFLFSAFFCLFLSASYHLFNCHSRFLNDILLLLDYSGISVLIAGSFIPIIYYGFYCNSWVRNFYLITVTVLSVMSFCIGMYSGLFPSRMLRLARVLAYSFNACFGMVPLGHMLVAWRGGEATWAPCFIFVTAMLGMYALGTVIYFAQFPERFWPHRFDFFFSSHQLWHLIVFGAALLHFFCVVGHFHWRTTEPCRAT